MRSPGRLCPITLSYDTILKITEEISRQYCAGSPALPMECLFLRHFPITLRLSNFHFSITIAPLGDSWGLRVKTTIVMMFSGVFIFFADFLAFLASCQGA